MSDEQATMMLILRYGSMSNAAAEWLSAAPGNYWLSQESDLIGNYLSNFSKRDRAA